MTISLERRKAFEAQFHLYGQILWRVASDDDCHLTNQMTKAHESIVDFSMIENVALVFMAQFVARVIKTRCNNSTDAMEKFGEYTIERYRFYRSGLLQNRDLYASARLTAAVNEYEAHMVEIIFHALATEATIHEEAMAEIAAEESREEFSEIDFWTDVFLALSVRHNGAKEPYWMLAIQEIFLNHKAEFRDALRAE